MLFNYTPASFSLSDILPLTFLSPPPVTLCALSPFDPSLSPLSISLCSLPLEGERESTERDREGRESR